MEEIATDKAPAAIGPYSQAIKANPFLFVSGQLPINPATNLFSACIKEQTRQCLHNIQAILEEADYALYHVVKVEIFVVDLAHFAEINAVYAEFFGKTKPARATVQVARLPKDVGIEIACVAYKK